MAFQNIDAPGNRHNRRAVAVIQRKAGAEGRIAAAQAKRQRKMARSFKKDLDRTIYFYDMPQGGVTIADPEGAYLNKVEIGNKRQVIVSGSLKASVDHYVKAIGLFLNTPMRLIGHEPLPGSDGKISSIIVEPS